MLQHIRRLYEKEIQLLTHVQPVLLFTIRLYWGYQFFLAGRGKLMNIERTTGFFESLHIPLPLLNAYMAGVTECFGGLLLLLGLASRVTTIPLIVTMCVAYATAHTAKLGGLFNNTDAFVMAPPFLFLLASIMILVFGPGWISVDGLIQHFVLRKCPLKLASRRNEHTAVLPAAHSAGS
jgi:putative oxidoreductase